jgi:hypothetical protein
MFLVSTDARSVVADQIDAAVAQLVEHSTYLDVALRFKWSKSNVQRRVTRYRARTGQKRPPRTRRSDQADTTTKPGRPAGAERTPSFVAP